ncbi:peptide methionine sulfoxide reductase MsrA [Candidatus Phycosocius spiralis]|uniref:Peptide methionine sulfoxide reductase MsrA n=2 Tax=Candidatus Phycosocius spiralis TaxID=2815099 RepID=A0ABQ4PW50_9PROT|nr:peptide methionine sulfoxide reductase MsrA [Candidatus Phycosocius spiralis]
MPAVHETLIGRATKMQVPTHHYVNGNSLQGPWPEPYKTILFGLGCFWGAERMFWQQEGVYSTAVGFSAGYTPNPTYEEVCSGLTGHNEVVLVVYDPNRIGLKHLIALFFENHDPTQGMRQGGDIGTQYRSGIYVSDAQELALAKVMCAEYGAALTKSGFGAITTEVNLASEFYYAEEYHQQYLAKNPGGYCGLGGTGVSCPIGTGISA